MSDSCKPNRAWDQDQSDGLYIKDLIIAFVQAEAVAREAEEADRHEQKKSHRSDSVCVECLCRLS